jgi:hypothetical protein
VTAGRHRPVGWFSRPRMFFRAIRPYQYGEVLDSRLDFPFGQRAEPQQHRPWARRDTASVSASRAIVRGYLPRKAPRPGLL